MEQVTLCLGFGSKGSAMAWATSMSVKEGSVSLGMRVQFQINLVIEDKPAVVYVVGQVCAAETMWDGSPIFYCYGGEELPELVIEKLEDNNWVVLTPEQAERAVEIMSTAPPSAATHTIFLLVGDPKNLDSEGVPIFEIWQKTLTPSVATLPAFGQRLELLVLPSNSENGVDPASFNANDIAETSLGVWPRSQNYMSEAERSLSVLIFYSGLFQIGFGAVGAWTPNMGSIDGFDMLEAGWKMPSSDALDLKGLRIAERIDLALRTHLTISAPDSDGAATVEDYFLGEAETVPESQYELLPSSLVEHVKASKDLANPESIFEQWRKELEEGNG